MSTSFDHLSPKNIVLSCDGPVAVIRLARPAKRNALDAATIEELIDIFSALPRSGLRAAVLCSEGDHFSAGLDLIEHLREERTAADFMRICLRWHEAFNKMEYSGTPIFAALKGAVVGGGLELASAAHVRIADRSTYFALPSNRRICPHLQSRSCRSICGRLCSRALPS